MKTYNWGIIGCGNVTELKSGPAYQKTNGFNLVAVMRRDAEKVKDYAHRHSVPKFYTNADELINDSEIDAVYIATPPDSHEYYALKVAKAGKICCIEKPMATSYEACVNINKAFKEKDLPLFVAYYRRSLPRFTKIKSWINDNKIGDIRHISWILNKPANSIDLSKTYNWRTDSAIAYGGYFDDLASHGLDLFTFLLGDISEANGFSINQQGLYSAMDAVTGNWIHNSGITGSGSWNFGCEKREDHVQIFGNKGKIGFSVFDENPISINSNGKIESFHIENPENIQIHHVQNIKSHLLNESLHPSTGSTATHTAWVMDRILK
ncbi:Gfo/Idh/MocA family oxidoreductase [Winogradskyella echinorum]|uniref:Gfo/Idh/MocA family oxidoreductase n=1 Tax=Winogradskyella echinorum TaxID=538189 RepID=A0ABR6XWI4_9FLAO|nr:Gfo/Idh/MocA family oxidoreductase [Winogradskyella echinorum]MBC3844851.1 Gfo/Idh/MocA family oxidoreductase [Winogradskyella echinorum]MBC5749199.1 Gfo/Idh/MocA family oxidoreductase [Winogradskyella echinorum]